jgi:phosphoglycolate phosphatase
MPNDLILFDLDGTLIDSSRDLCTSVNKLRADLSLAPLELRAVLAGIGNGARSLVQKSLPDPPPVPVDDALQRFRAIYAAHLLDTTQPYPGIEALLARRVGQPMAVVSNKPERFTRRIVEALGWADSFAPVLGGDSLPTRKPSPEMLLAACAAHDADPRHCIMVGDGPQDIAAGRAAGMRVVAVSWGFHARRALESLRPDHLVGDARELDQVLTRAAVSHSCAPAPGADPE